MREIKNFMKSKSSWRCGNPKECITPAQRRCNDELCWCWGDGWAKDKYIIGNKAFAHSIKYRPSEREFYIFMRNNWEDYISVDFVDFTNISLHWAYIGDPGAEAIEDILLSMGELVQVFGIGTYDWNITNPTEGTEWFYADEFMMELSKVYEDPSMENIGNFMNYLMDLLMEIERTGDYSKLPLHYTKCPSRDDYSIIFDEHEIVTTPDEYGFVQIPWTLLPRQFPDYNPEWVTCSANPQDAISNVILWLWDNNKYRTSFRAERTDTPVDITLSKSDWTILDTCHLYFR